SNASALLGVAEASHHSISGPNALHFDHGRALARRIGGVQSLGDNPIQADAAQLAHPLLRLLAIGSRRGKPVSLIWRDSTKKLLEPAASFGERQLGKQLSRRVH